MSSVTLNLSRKWRSQDFDQIVGQDLAVRILKNSLYLGHYFPVYLFAGQRGCGKTSTARIFAAAVNCHALPMFQKDPKKSSIPCLICESCIAMRNGNHPDFVEIDAASHTGVDNIRSIIESSSLLAVMGRKRVYLIDEAHMLSKAAFNAALKILEEPPATALFILATTNPHKIIDTVKSRCFQLFFTAIAHAPLKNHLQTICKNEKISYTDDALDLIIRHTQGSARDALNLLEQVKFSSSTVHKDAVLALLGHIDDQQIMSIIQFTLQGESVALVHLLQSLAIDKHKAEFIWERMIVLLRALLWIKYGVKPQELIASVKMLEENARLHSTINLQRMVEVLYAHEELFLKTSLQNIFLEMVLLDLCSQDKKKNDNGDGSAPCVLGAVTNDSGDVIDDEEEAEEDDTDDEAVSFDEKWQRFVVKTETINDPLIHSLFKQSRFISYAAATSCISIELSKDFILFKERFECSKQLWQPLLEEFFAARVTLDIQFTGTQKTEISKKARTDDVIVKQQPAPLQHKEKQFVPSGQQQFRGGVRYNAQKTVPSVINKNELRIDVSDENKWKKAALLLHHFPGTITEIRENL